MAKMTFKLPEETIRKMEALGSIMMQSQVQYWKKV